MNISLVLNKQRVTEQGTMPVTIRVYENKKNQYKSTGVYVLPEDWQEGKNGNLGEVKKSDPDHQEKNVEILNAYLKVKTPEGTTPELEVSGKPTNLVDVFTEILEEGGKPSTYAAKKTAFTFLAREVPKSLLRIDRFNQSVYDNIREIVLKSKQGQRGVGANAALKYLISAYIYANKLGYVKNYKPVKHKNVPTIPKPVEEKLNYEDFRKLFWEYLELRRRSINESASALDIFGLMLCFQGIPPVDVALLKVSDIRKIEESSIILDPNKYNQNSSYRKRYDKAKTEIVAVTYRRKKTGELVEIYANWKLVAQPLSRLTLGKKPSDYLLPVFKEERIKKAEERGNLDGYIRSTVSKYFTNLASELRDRHLINKVSCCTKDFTYYDARRGYVTLLLNQSNVPVHLVQKLVGHKTSILIDHYYQQPRPYEIADLLYQIGLEVNEKEVDL